MKKKSRYFFASIIVILCAVLFYYGKESEKKSWKTGGVSSGVVFPEKETSDLEEIASGQEVKPRVAITFDDGPHEKYTPQLLDGLKEREVRATFFLIGENIPGKEAIVRRMAEEGHLIGNHTYSHVKLSGMDPEAACEEVRKTSDLIREITGKPAEYIRPPFGAWDKSQECEFPLFPVLWTVDTLDWTTKNVSDVVRRGTEEVKDGDILLLHDCYASSVEAALRIIDILRDRGFCFVTAEELLLE